VDDSFTPSQGFATTGPWVNDQTGSYGGYLGNVHYASAGTGGSVATWTFPVSPGQYDVSVTYYSYADRASNAPYTVLDGSTSLGTVLVNQQVPPSGITDQGANWLDLGTFVVSGNHLVVQLSNNANGYVIADAVRIAFLGTIGDVQVLDGSTQISNGGADAFGSTYVGTPITKTFTVKNASSQALTLGAFGSMPAGFTLTQGFGSTSLAPGASTTFQVSLSGSAAGSYSGTVSFGTSDTNFPTYSFTVSGTVATQPTVQIVDDSFTQGFATTGPWVNDQTGSYGGYLGNVHFASAGTGGSVASWTFTVSPGQYDVSVTYYSYADRATNAPYTVLDGSTALGTVLVNQQVPPSGITDQGANWLDLGSFTITGNQLVVQLSNNANGYVIADAVRIQKLS
jgi:hypothetical protein